jgi:hypothetical protein
MKESHPFYEVTQLPYVAWIVPVEQVVAHDGIEGGRLSLGTNRSRDMICQR